MLHKVRRRVNGEMRDGIKHGSFKIFSFPSDVGRLEFIKSVKFLCVFGLVKV